MIDFEVSERVVTYEKGKEVETIIAFKPMNPPAEQWFMEYVRFHHECSAKMNGAYEVRPNIAMMLISYVIAQGFRITFWADVQ